MVIYSILKKSPAKKKEEKARKYLSCEAPSYQNVRQNRFTHINTPLFLIIKQRVFNKEKNGKASLENEKNCISVLKKVTVEETNVDVVIEHKQVSQPQKKVLGGESYPSPLTTGRFPRCFLFK